MVLRGRLARDSGEERTMEKKNETTKSDCGRWWTRPILGSDIAIDHVLEPNKYASRAPYERRDYDGGVTSPCSPEIPGWLVTGIERVKNKDGREAVMLDLEWGVFSIHMNDHTNAMTWTWNDEALHDVLCHKDGTPLTVCEAFDLELVEEGGPAVDADEPDVDEPDVDEPDVDEPDVDEEEEDEDVDEEEEEDAVRVWPNAPPWPLGGRDASRDEVAPEREVKP
jgi:hypothetical protein